MCSVCGYRTHCSKAYPDHMITKHGRLANPENTNREFSTGFMECICGVVHIDGNKMGRFVITSQPHQWRNGWRACLECCRSWVRVPVGSNQRL